MPGLLGLQSVLTALTGLSVLAGAAVVDDKTVKRDSAVPFGPIIEHCTVPGTVALTFDDGPYIYTSHVLDLLDQYGAKATFFVNGDNYGRGLIDDPATAWPDILRRMVNSNHQIGSHTWDHVADLSTTDAATRQDEMKKLEVALTNVLGHYPTYMRPPFASCNDVCQADMATMGYHVINFDVDTKDYEHDTPDDIHVAMDTFANAVTGDPATSSYLVLSHDVHENTANSLVEFELQTLQQRGFKAVTVGECLGDDAANWYRTSV
ncbi:polysaccharide deacetylase [Thozetella sp. PMI_491]|nr:polysaccharide deacetylase [Thozetella sp. PMI_491]